MKSHLFRHLPHRLFIVFFFFLLASCAAPSPRVEHQFADSNGKIQTELLSEYFASKQLVDDGRLLVHLIVTLGKERVPPDEKVDIAFRDRLFSDQIEAVKEIYFTNKSDKAITLGRAKLLSEYGKSGAPNDPEKTYTDDYSATFGPAKSNIRSATLEAALSSWRNSAPAVMDFFATPITLAPGKWVKSPAFVGVSSRYRAAGVTLLLMQIDGRDVALSLKERRMPVSELGNNNRVGNQSL